MALEEPGKYWSRGPGTRPAMIDLQHRPKTANPFYPLGTGQGGLVLRKEKRLHERRVMAESQLEGGTRTKERKRKPQEAQSPRAFSIRSSPCWKEDAGAPASTPGGRRGVFGNIDLRLRMQLVW